MKLPAVVVAKDCLSPQCQEAEGEMLLEPLMTIFLATGKNQICGVKREIETEKGIEEIDNIGSWGHS